MGDKKNNWLFPKNLWTSSFTFWWWVSLATVLLFDILWMLQTTFRPFSFFVFYPFLFLQAFLLTIPSMITRRGWLNLILLLLVDFFMIANLMYCRTYYNAIPLQSYGLVGNLSDFGPSVADSFRWYFLSLPVLTILAFCIYASIKPWFWGKKNPSWWMYLASIIILGLIGWAGDVWRGGTMKQISDISGRYYAAAVVPMYSLGGFWPMII